MRRRRRSRRSRTRSTASTTTVISMSGLAQRLVADGEHVVDVPAKLSGARVFSTVQGRKTDATDAHSVAIVALRTRSLRLVRPDDRTVALRLLADRRDELGAARTLTINRLHRLLVELVPGGAKKVMRLGLTGPPGFESRSLRTACDMRFRRLHRQQWIQVRKVLGRGGRLPH